MNFFEHQSKARKKTALFIFLFCLAVFFISVAFYFIILLLLNFTNYSPYYQDIWSTELFSYVFLITLGFISSVSLFKILILKTGAETIARSLGGRKVDENTKDPDERRLLNIIEEISIASGCPIPKVYLLDNEDGINAFAAGFSIKDSVIAVTKGALKNLSRNELQGVIAHEYSHILNGDMRINLRLVGFLFGIFSLTLLGKSILRLAVNLKGRKNMLDITLLFFAIALIVVGSIGFFFGRLIQAAISRQREYLADASAVQFTRDPTSIGGALLKIALLENGSKLKTHAATQISHMLFSPYDAISGLLATHPPILKRIERICPDLLRFISNKKIPTQSELSEISFKFSKSQINQLSSSRHFSQIVGTLNSDSIEQAYNIIQNFSVLIKDSINESKDIDLILYSLFLSDNKQIKNEQLKYVAEDNTKIIQYHQHTIKLDVNSKLALIEILCNKLKTIDTKQRENILLKIKQLILYDNNISFYELALYSFINQRLKISTKDSIYSIKECKNDIYILLGIVSFAGESENIEKAFKAFTAGLSLLKLTVTGDMNKYVRNISPDNFEEVLNAINKLSVTSLSIRKKIIESIYKCITFDNVIKENEVLLLRVTGLILECPVPVVF